MITVLLAHLAQANKRIHYLSPEKGFAQLISEHRTMADIARQLALRDRGNSQYDYMNRAFAYQKTHQIPELVNLFAQKERVREAYNHAFFKLQEQINGALRGVVFDVSIL